MIRPIILLLVLFFVSVGAKAQDDSFTESVEQSPEWQTRSSSIIQDSEVAVKKDHWWNHKKNWFYIGAYVGSSLYATRSISSCRARNDIGRCPQGGYGPYPAREGIRWATGGGLLILSIYANEHWPTGTWNSLLNSAPISLFSAYNIRVAISDRNVPTIPKKDASLLPIILKKGI